MQVFLLRHGNTFNTGDHIVRVGSKTDLPLTQKGLEQAREFGNYLSQSNHQIDRFYSGPLIRHRQHSKTIADCIGFCENDIINDERLQEIDYGQWEAKSDDEIILAGFKDDLENWNKNAIWPPADIWAETQEQLDTRVEDFLKMLKLQTTHNQKIVVVTSGGVLRSFHSALIKYDTAFKGKPSKVSTGHVGSIQLNHNSWKIDYWNQHPENI